MISPERISQYIIPLLKAEERKTELGWEEGTSPDEDE